MGENIMATNSVVGTWFFDLPAFNSPFGSRPGRRIDHEFLDDGTYKFYDSKNGRWTGTYTVEGNQITVYNSSRICYIGSLSASGDKLTLGPPGGDTMSYMKK